MSLVSSVLGLVVLDTDLSRASTSPEAIRMISMIETSVTVVNLVVIDGITKLRKNEMTGADARTMPP